MKWQEEDLHFLNSAATELSDYLDSTVFDWQMRQSRISLTPGRVLLSIARLSSVKVVDGKTLTLISSIKEIINLKKTTWHQKIAQEFPRRLKIWENLINDFAEEGVDKTFAVQIVNRVILSLLEMEYPMSSARYASRMDKIDELLRKMIIPGEFIWDSQLESVFTKKEFWFLFCEPAKG
jgi:hypothetical protein